MSLEQYNAARTRAGVVRMTWAGMLRLAGPDRTSWLQGMVTNDVEELKAGDGCYAAHLTAQGKVVAQMVVLETGEETLLLLELSAAERLAAVFDRLIIMEEVQVQDVSDQYVLFELTGPHGAAILREQFVTSLPKAGSYGHVQTEPSGPRIVAGDLGYVLVVPKSLADRAEQRLVAAGAVSIGEDVWNILRAEMGVPLYGVDIDDTTTLPELGPRGIDYDKGCYIGQEVVARIKYIGHVNRRFVGIVCDGQDVPEFRSSVQFREKDVGYVTTSVFSPDLGKVIALGFVSRAAAEPGTDVTVGEGNSRISAKVAALPFLPIRFAD